MSILTFSPVANSMDHPLSTYLLTTFNDELTGNDLMINEDVRRWNKNLVPEILREHKSPRLAVHLSQFSKRLEAALDVYGSFFCDNCVLLRFQTNI